MKYPLVSLIVILTNTALADTTYLRENIPGTNIPSGTRPSIAIERTYGTTTVYQTVPGTSVRDPSAPSYTVVAPAGGGDLDMSQQMERLGRGEE